VKRKFLTVLCVALMAFAGIANANPNGDNGRPDSDPTCGDERPSQSSQPEGCPGDNGEPGCQGINVAREHVPEQGQGALDLVADILSDDDKGNCESDG
jgi:hypothetical protein